MTRSTTNQTMLIKPYWTVDLNTTIKLFRFISMFIAFIHSNTLTLTLILILALYTYYVFRGHMIGWISVCLSVCGKAENFRAFIQFIAFSIHWRLRSDSFDLFCHSIDVLRVCFFSFVFFIHAVCFTCIDACHRHFCDHSENITLIQHR